MPRELADDIMTVAEVSADLRCSKAHTYHLINGTVRGVSPLPAISIGRLRRVRRSALEEWKRTNEQQHVNAMIDPSLKNYAV
jgi:excisionase family DNA binding protein